MEEKIILSLLVDNTSGVLSRIAGLFSRRAYNIDSLTVGVTANPKISRMTIVSRGDNQILGQIEAQLQKQEDVRDIKVLTPDSSVSRELILVKVMADVTNRRDIIAIASIFRANIIDVQKDSLIVELTGSKPKLEAMIDMLSDFQIAEIARTGITGLSRGSQDVKYL
ncbi:MAG TPA: acetolactate synthase small subunit [Lachnospiraceae bacterium]|nr:acetolactate synthase small subunit [Lachnospiraceae bacterium]